jgi:hypothetical protein
MLAMTGVAQLDRLGETNRLQPDGRQKAENNY